MDSSTYIKSRIQSLRQDSEEIREQSPVTNDFDSWSVLKLILHSAAVNMYTTVLQNQDWINDLYYIDALAGSGVSTYNEAESCFLGSPIIAAKVADQPFEKMYLIESDPDKADALETRMEYVFSEHDDAEEPNDWDVIPEDANEELPRISKDIMDRSAGGFNYYCFIDNQELNVKWDAIDALTPKPWGDFLINIPTSSGVGRNATKTPVPKELNDFYCMDLNSESLPNSGVRPHMKALYSQCLRENGRSVQRMTNIDANVGSYEYDLVYATRETDGGSGYIKVIDHVKKFIEDIHAGHVDDILSVLYDDQTMLESHLPSEDIDEELPDSGDEDNKNQTNLGDFCG